MLRSVLDKIILYILKLLNTKTTQVIFEAFIILVYKMKASFWRKHHFFHKPNA